MTVEILDSGDALAALAPAWQGLWQRAGRSVFQSPHWLLPWWEAFGAGAPLVATYQEGGALAGVLPAYIFREAGGAKLLPIGAGTTDYLDGLGEGAAPMLAALLDRAGQAGVQHCELMDIPPGGTLRGATVPAPWQATWSEGSACPVLPLDAVAHGALRKLRMNRNRAVREGGWTVTEAGPDTLAAAFETFVAMHQARWRSAGEPGVLCDPAVLRFHRLAAPRLLASGLLRICVLQVGGAPAAAIMALRGPGRLEFYLSGYDAARAFVSPGSLLLGAMLEQAQGEGVAEAHFLRGREGYKYAWGATDRMNETCAITREASALAGVRLTLDPGPV